MYNTHVSQYEFGHCTVGEFPQVCKRTVQLPIIPGACNESVYASDARGHIRTRNYIHNARRNSLCVSKRRSSVRASKRRSLEFETSEICFCLDARRATWPGGSQPCLRRRQRRHCRHRDRRRCSRRLSHRQRRHARASAHRRQRDLMSRLHLIHLLRRRRLCGGGFRRGCWPRPTFLILKFLNLSTQVSFRIEKHQINKTQLFYATL